MFIVFLEPTGPQIESDKIEESYPGVGCPLVVAFVVVVVVVVIVVVVVVVIYVCIYSFVCLF
jgi:hypothetical protein